MKNEFSTWKVIKSDLGNQLSNYKMKENIGVEEGEVNMKVAVCNYEVVLREKVATC